MDINISLYVKCQGSSMLLASETFCGNTSCVSLRNVVVLLFCLIPLFYLLHFVTLFISYRNHLSHFIPVFCRPSVKAHTSLRPAAILEEPEYATATWAPPQSGGRNKLRRQSPSIGEPRPPSFGVVMGCLSCFLETDCCQSIYCTNYIIKSIIYYIIYYFECYPCILLLEMRCPCRQAACSVALYLAWQQR